MSYKLISSLALGSLLACGSPTEPESPGNMPPAVGTEIQITTDSANQQGPAISGNRIAYYADRNDLFEIYMYDLTKGVESQITTDPALQRLPDISGNRIVWVDYRNGHANPDIYMYELTVSADQTLR